MADGVVLITGASSGIGNAIAGDLSRNGYHVIAAMRAPEGKNATVAKGLQTSGGRCDVVEIDVTNDASVAAGVSEAVRLAGRIDVLVNCAGIMWLGVSEAFTIAQFDAVMQANLYGPFRMMRAVLPHMRARQSGLVIAVTSIAGRMVTPGSGIYAASKFGLEALTEAIRYETSSLGIDCILVEPGPFRTNLKTNSVPPEDTDVADAYGPLRELQKLLPERMGALLQQPGVTTDPMAVAECIRRLIAMPAGTRPMRTTVGLDFGTGDLNRAVAPHQHAYLAAMGLEECEKIASA
jgi:NAD(P)-dependent dehydrogenase (short-subunit alcohol dehydrogenase family)